MRKRCFPIGKMKRGKVFDFSLTKKPRFSLSTFAGFIMKGGVVPPGIEPGTHGFSVRCSTN